MPYSSFHDSLKQFDAYADFVSKKNITDDQIKPLLTAVLRAFKLYGFELLDLDYYLELERQIDDIVDQEDDGEIERETWTIDELFKRSDDYRHVNHRKLIDELPEIGSLEKVVVRAMLRDIKGLATDWQELMEEVRDTAKKIAD